MLFYLGKYEILLIVMVCAVLFLTPYAAYALMRLKRRRAARRALEASSAKEER